MKTYTTDKKKRLLSMFDKITKLDPNRKIREKILIVDSLNLFIRSFCVVSTLNPDGIHIGGIQGSLTSLQYAIKQIRPTKIIMVWDGRGGSKHRRAIYDGYKANRGKGLKGLNRTVEWLNEKQEEESCINQINRFIQYTDSLPVVSVAVDGVEADDVIAYIANSLFPEDKKVIMSTDKDFYQLVNKNITVFRPTTKEIVDRKWLDTKFGITPENFVLYRALDGDPSDNIPGVKGIALKTAKKLFPELGDKEILDVNYIIEKASQNLDMKPMAKIFNDKEIVERNHALMQLSETIIPSQTISLILGIVNGQKIPLFNRTQLKKMLLEDKIYMLIKNLASWHNIYADSDSSARVFNKKLVERN